MHCWKSARLAGYLANVRRSQVVDFLIRRLYNVLARKDWVRAEAAFISSNGGEMRFNQLQSLLIRKGGFPAVLRRDAASIERRRKVITSWYADLTERYGVCSDQLLCTLAIDIASRPHEVPRLYRDELPELLRRIMAKPLLLRGARMIALYHADADNQLTELLPRWE